MNIYIYIYTFYDIYIIYVYMYITFGFTLLPDPAKGAAPAAPAPAAPAAPLREPLSRRALTARAGNEEVLRLLKQNPCGFK